jgi:hypothetical protein
MGEASGDRPWPGDANYPVPQAPAPASSEGLSTGAGQAEKPQEQAVIAQDTNAEPAIEQAAEAVEASEEKKESEAAEASEAAAALDAATGAESAAEKAAASAGQNMVQKEAPKAVRRTAQLLRTVLRAAKQMARPRVAVPRQATTASCSPNCARSTQTSSLTPARRSRSRLRRLWRSPSRSY